MDATTMGFMADKAIELHDMETIDALIKEIELLDKKYEERIKTVRKEKSKAAREPRKWTLFSSLKEGDTFKLSAKDKYLSATREKTFIKRTPNYAVCLEDGSWKIVDTLTEVLPWTVRKSHAVA